MVKKYKTKEEELKLVSQVHESERAKMKLKQEGLSEKDKEELLHVVYLGELAIEEIIQNYINMARGIATRYWKRSQTRVALEDLVQEALMGLHHATLKFDVTRGFKLGTYAYYEMTKRVTTSIDEGRFVRMPANKMLDFGKINKARTKYNPLDTTMSEKEFILKETGLKERDYDVINFFMKPMISLNVQVGVDYHDPFAELIDFIESDEFIYQGSDFQDELIFLFSELSEFEKQILAQEFGIIEVEESFDEFLTKYNLTQKSFNSKKRALIKKLKEKKGQLNEK